MRQRSHEYPKKCSTPLLPRRRQGEGGSYCNIRFVDRHLLVLPPQVHCLGCLSYSPATSSTRTSAIPLLIHYVAYPRDHTLHRSAARYAIIGASRVSSPLPYVLKTSTTRPTPPPASHNPHSSLVLTRTLPFRPWSPFWSPQPHLYFFRLLPSAFP